MVPLIGLPFAGIALVVGQFAMICQSQVNEFWSLSQPFKGGQFLGLQNFILAREADDRTIFDNLSLAAMFLVTCCCKRGSQRFLLSRTVACHAVRAINFFGGLVRAFVGEPPLVVGLHSPLKFVDCIWFSVV